MSSSSESQKPVHFFIHTSLKDAVSNSSFITSSDTLNSELLVQTDVEDGSHEENHVNT